MSIVYDKTSKTITLHTLKTSYQMKIGNLHYLSHLYYGPRLSDSDLSYQIMQYDRGFSGNPYKSRNERTFSLDAQPQEYIRAKGLEPERLYRIEQLGIALTGSALMYAGIPIPREIPQYSSFQYHLVSDEV